MSLQVQNGTAPSINWESLLQQVGNLSKPEAAGEKPVLTISLTEADGTQRTVQINIPDDLDLPSTVDQAAIDSLCAKLAADPDLGIDAKQIEEFRAALTSVLQADGVPENIQTATSSKSLLFDLYKLLALLVEVAQKQRDASRDLRAAEAQQIQTSIVNQANIQRSAARNSMIASAACCIVQGVAMGYSMYKQASAFRTQLASLETSGVGSARQDLAMLKAGESANGAVQQLNDTRASVGAPTANRVATSFERAEIARATAQLKEVQLNNDTAKLQRLQNVNAPLQEGDIPNHPDLETATARANQFQEMKQLQTVENPNEQQTNRLTELQNQFRGVTEQQVNSDLHAAQLDSANTRLNEFREIGQLQNNQPLTQEQTARLATLQEKYANVTEQQLTDALNEARQPVAADLQATFAEKQTALTAARADANSKLNSTLKTYQDAYDNAVRQRANVNPKASKAEIKTLDANLQKAEADLRFARAYVANERVGITTTAERQNLTAKAEVRLAEAQNMMRGDTSYIKAGQLIQRQEGINLLINSVGQCVQSMIQNYNSMRQADATEVGAAQTQMQEDLEQMKDLFSQSGDLVQSVLQLMNAINAAESQSMRDAIQV